MRIQIFHSKVWVFNINPIAASRPRLSRYGAFFTGPYKKFREEAAMVVDSTLDTHSCIEDIGLDVKLYLFIEKPKTSKLLYPRPDVDNYAKSILDLLNGKLWKDDQQVIQLLVNKQWSKYDVGYFTIEVSPMLS